MTPREQLKQLRKLAEAKSAFIDQQLLALEKLLDKLSPKLADKIAETFLTALNVKDGVIDPSIFNQNKVALLDAAYASFMEQHGKKIIVTMMDDLKTITGLNEEYFKELSGMKIDAKQVNKVIYNRLGLAESDGKLKVKSKGFMKGVFDSAPVRTEVANFAIEKISNGTGFEDMRKGLRELIAGNDEKMGKFSQFYRNAAYDTYAKVDALNGKLYSDKLKLKYFIYAGTRRKTSRHFCIKRKGKVFSTEEAEEWKDLIGTYEVGENGKPVKAGPIVTGEDIPTYDPVVDRGGYGCVDDIMWIGDDIAFDMRPDLKPKK